MKHAWPPIGIDQTDLLRIKTFLKNGNYYDITLHNTPLDIAFAKTLEKMGKTVKIGSNLKIENDLLVQGNTLINIIFDQRLKNNMNKIFQKHKKLDETAIQEIITKIVMEKTNIQVIIKEDENKAEKIRKEILKELNKK
jgi:hypothetical protein